MISTDTKLATERCCTYQADTPDDHAVVVNSGPCGRIPLSQLEVQPVDTGRAHPDSGPAAGSH